MILVPVYTTLVSLCDTCCMDQRADRLTAVQVDLAVNIASVFGLASGVQSLHECGIEPSVI